MPIVNKTLNHLHMGMIDPITLPMLWRWLRGWVGEKSDHTVQICGRIKAKRGHGKAIFANV